MTFTVRGVRAYLICQGFLAFKKFWWPPQWSAVDPLDFEPQNEQKKLRIFLLCLTSANSWNSLDLALKTKQKEEKDGFTDDLKALGKRWEQTNLSSGFCPCYLSPAAGVRCQHRHALTRTHPARLTGPTGSTNTEDKPNTLPYCIDKKQQMQEV